MTRQTFNNDYDIIVYAFPLLIRWFKEENNIFAAQCIWWLASIIQYTEIFKFYLEYQIIPWTYGEDCVVTPLPRRVHEETIIPDSDIPEPQSDFDTAYCSKSTSQYIAEERSIVPVNWRMPSGRIFTPVNLTNKELRQWYLGLNKKQLQALRTSLRKDGWIKQEI